MRPHTSLIAALAALTTVACSQTPPNATQIIPVGKPPIGGIDGGGASVPVGIVVGFSLASTSPPTAYYETSSVTSSGTATVDDPSLVSLLPSALLGTYVLVGLSPGETTLHAAAADATPTTLQVVVSAQAPAP